MEQRLIDANALMERLERKKCEPAKVRYTEGFNDALMRFRSMVHGAPTVDAVLVVRCSECVHFTEWTAYEKTCCGFQHDGMCKYWNHHSTNKNSFCDHGLRITDGYCADGERRSE